MPNALWMPGLDEIDLCDPINWQSPLNDGLVSWWLTLPQLHGGPIFHDLVNFNNGSFVSGPVWSTWLERPGGFGASLRIAASSKNERVEVAGTGLPTGATAEWAFAYWHYTVTYISLAHDFGWGRQFPTSDGLHDQRGSLQYQNDYYFWGDGSDWDSGVAHVVGAWTHAGYESRGGNIYLYLNGVQNASATLPAGLATSSTYITFGSCHRDVGTSAPSAYYDDGRIWNKAIGPGGFAAVYQDCISGHRDTLNRMPLDYFLAPVVATGNRRRRLLISAA